ncbi:MAG: hypothetical protein JWM43_1984 [Acidobacteriaceae bacterium]|nr:hypothetical protein [Acidobacteriaceae bacterium]
MRTFVARISLFLFLISAGSFMQAQTASSMTGVVTDASGGVVPGTTVSLANAQTGVSFKALTDSSGSYRFANVPAGPGYKATFTHDGYATSTVKDVYLQIGVTRSQDVKLGAGTNVEIEVSAASQEVTINTTDASIGNNFDVKMVNELPVQDRSNLQILFSLQPGVTSVGSVTGARQDQNETTLDGMDVNDIASGQTNGTFSIVGGAPADAVQEFRGTTAGLGAGIGTGSGGQFQLVTKSGENRFHGNVNEYHRDVSTVANSWFNNNSTVPIPRTKLIRNQFGGNIGGPIWRNKLFFFFDYNNGRTIQASTTTRVVPLDSFRAGTIGYTNNGTGCSSASRRNTAANCISDYSPAQIAAIDPQLIGNNAALFSYVNGRYPHANDLTLGDGINTGGYRFTQSTNQILYNYVGRVDYNLTSRQKVFVQYHTLRSDGIQTLNQFDVDPVTYPVQNRSYGYVASHTWQIGTNKVNQFYYGDNISKLLFPVNYSPTGITSYTFSPLAAPNGSLSSQSRRVPIPTVRDDFNWTIGSHTLQLGGTFKFIKTNSRLIGDFEAATVGIGGLNTALNSSLRPSNINTNATVVSRWDTAFPFALGRIAVESRNYNYDNNGNALVAGTGSVRRYRYYQTEAYLGDTWKATSALTLSYGVRYEYYSVPFEANGIQSNPNLGFDEYIAARLAQSNASSSGNAALPFFVYNLGGKANNASDVYKPSYLDIAPRFAFTYALGSDRKTVINGSVGKVYDRTVINAINFVQDQLSYLFQNTQQTNYGSSVSANAALANDPRLGANLSHPAVPGPVAISKPFTPYVSAAGVPNGIVNGQVNYAIDKNFKSPYSIAFNAGMQREVKGGFIVSGSYVGRLGRRLMGQADASQLLDYPDPLSAQKMSAAFSTLSNILRANPTLASSTAGLNSIAPQPWFENQISSKGIYASKTANVVANAGSSLVTIGDFADVISTLQANGLIGKNVGIPAQFVSNTMITNKGWSTYHGGLLTVTKNTSHGLQFQFNYTYAHSIDNVSTVANYIGLNTFTGQICDALNTSACRGNSDFDVKHNITANFVYDLPFGRGRSFGGSTNRWLDLAIGGWSVSGIPSWRSGYAFGTTTGAFLAGDSNDAPGIFNGDKSAVKVNIHKDSSGRLFLFDDPVKAAAAFSNPSGFQYGSRNNLRGPGALNFDAGLAKTFHIIGDRLNFKFRADGFNVLNHPVFNNPVSRTATNINNSGTFGQLTTQPTVGRDTFRVAQFSGRLEF